MFTPDDEGKAARRYLSDAYRYTPGEGWEKLADMPTALWVLRQYSTRTVSFEELARDEQLAFIAELNACEQADPALKVDRSWPEAMCVTLRRGSADSPDETKLACELTCGMTDGGSVTF